MRVLRTCVQLLILGGVTALAIRGLAGLTANTCETYCPFGGVAALYPLVRFRVYTCALTEFNMALLVSLVGLTVLAKKSFCGWICPLGSIQEWLSRLGRRVFGRSFRPPARLDTWLMPLRYVVLAAVLALTWTVWQGDLGFRAYDPYYILFTLGGHETRPWSIGVLVGVLGAAVLLPMAWCRYLCPLGAVMDPLSRFGLLRVRRNEEACTDCGACDELCPHAIPISKTEEVTARNCTDCFECVAGCPERGALEISWLGR